MSLPLYYTKQYMTEKPPVRSWLSYTRTHVDKGLMAARMCAPGVPRGGWLEARHKRRIYRVPKRDRKFSLIRGEREKQSNRKREEPFNFQLVSLLHDIQQFSTPASSTRDALSRHPSRIWQREKSEKKNKNKTENTKNKNYNKKKSQKTKNKFFDKFYTDIKLFLIN